VILYANALQILRIAATIARRRSIASADRSPCFHIIQGSGLSSPAVSLPAPMSTACPGLSRFLVC